MIGIMLVYDKVYVSQMFFKSLHGVVGNIMDIIVRNCAIMFSFRLILWGKVWTYYSFNYGLDSTTTVLQGWLWH